MYDGIGNPLTYRGATLAWYGRQLRSFTKNGITSTMNYDADGLRSSKTVAGVKTEYQYVGDKLFYEKRGDGNSFYYFYDSYGKLSAIYHHVNGNKTAYHVVTNAQGDVIALYSWTGTKVAEYSYDAWGNCTIVSDTSGTGIASLNPMRYRSYYYDSDLGLYYLQSRYYDSEIGRFINADGYITTGQGVMSYNMFSYCQNNPVMSEDSKGTSPDTRTKSRDYSDDDTVSIFTIIVLAIVALYCYTQTTTAVATYPTMPFSIPKAEEKEKEITKPLPSSTVIYRHGGTNPGNLTPKDKDKYTGLSFSTIPKPGSAVTTIEALNATGVVYATKDGPTHVSVRPVDATVEDWINAGSSSIWTQAVKSVVIKWDGVS